MTDIYICTDHKGGWYIVYGAERIHAESYAEMLEKLRELEGMKNG